MDYVKGQDLLELRRKYHHDVQQHGEEHPLTGLRLLELGDAYELSNAFEQAEKHYKLAADVFQRLGLDHELLQAIAIKSAAEMAQFQNNKSEAAKLKAEARLLVRTCFYRDFGLNGSDEPNGVH